MTPTFEEMYQDLLTMENVSGYLGVPSDDDGEEFMTSKEMVKAQKEAEERFGIKPAAKVTIEEEIGFKSYAKKWVHKYTEKELTAIREGCEETIVHDYGDNDIFHMSDEDRAKNDMLAELSMKLGGLKRTYRRVDQYIEAMRIVVQAWKLLEKQGNYLHTQDEFFTLVGNERIVSNRIIMPKLKKMDIYNIDQIIKYISNPDLDPADLMHDANQAGTYDPDNDYIEDRVEYQEYYDEYMASLSEEDLELDEYDIRHKADRYAKDKLEEEDAMRLLSVEEAEYLNEYLDNPPEMEVGKLSRRYIKGYDERSTFRSSRRNKSNRRKLSKADRVIRADVHDMLIKLQNNPANREIDEYNRSYLITHGMFDTSKREKDFWDDLFFDGSWANKADVYLYDLATREEFLKLHPPKERYQTYADKELNTFFQVAERNGINVTELRRKMQISESGVITSAEVREKTKENKKMESQIIQRLSKLNNDPKFKKLVEKSEKALNKYYENQ